MCSYLRKSESTDEGFTVDSVQSENVSSFFDYPLFIVSFFFSHLYKTFSPVLFYLCYLLSSSFDPSFSNILKKSNCSFGYKLKAKLHWNPIAKILSSINPFHPKSINHFALVKCKPILAKGS